MRRRTNLATMNGRSANSQARDLIDSMNLGLGGFPESQVSIAMVLAKLGTALHPLIRAQPEAFEDVLERRINPPPFALYCNATGGIDEGQVLVLPDR